MPNLPSPDALFYHIKKLDVEKIIAFEERFVEAIVDRTRSIGFLKKLVDTTIECMTGCTTAKSRVGFLGQNLGMERSMHSGTSRWRSFLGELDST